MKFIITVLFLCLLSPILFLIAATPEPCEHEDMVEWYMFSYHEHVSKHSVEPYCRDCGYSGRYRLFEGELVDKSYLQAIVENSDGNEIVPGEYYTVTARIPVGIYTPNSRVVLMGCEVENEDFIVRFNAVFREEFEEAVKSLEKGDVITFRGRFYETGCEFDDCELLSVSNHNE